MRPARVFPRERLHQNRKKDEDYHGVVLSKRKIRRGTRGIQFYFLITVSILLSYELYLRFYVLSPGRPIILDKNTFHSEHHHQQRHHHHEHHRQNRHAGSNTRNRANEEKEEPLTIEIFSAPKPFIGPDKEDTLRAIRSWQNLNPQPNITLLGYETGYDTVVEEYGLGIQPDVDKTFLGVPLFNSMFHIANQSNAKVSVIINGDIILLQEFIDTIRTVMRRFEDFLVISARYDLTELPANLTESNPNFYQELGTYARENGILHTYGGMDLWAWNSHGSRLFNPVMPHFIFGRGKYDNWLTHETISAGRRAVIDASEAVLSIHISHGYNLVQNSNQKENATNKIIRNSISRRHLLALPSLSEQQHQKSKQFWSENKKTKFELFINIYLSLKVGTYENQMGTIGFAPWRLASCLESRGNCFLRRLRPGVCNCEYSPTNAQTQTDEKLKDGSRVIRCGMVSREETSDYEIAIMTPSNEENKIQNQTFGMPLTLESLVKRVAVDDTIIVTASNFEYREMLMNWVCNMRRIRVTNFIIAALDEDLYRYSFVRGLPVFMDKMVWHGKNGTLVSDVAYGSSEFKALTKMKSRVVIEVLKLGYDTVWTDTDIIWFRNPIEHLQLQGVDLAIQSNALDGEAANYRRRLNSGFYLAKANERMISMFKEVIAYASRSKMPEQRCFYDVICGENGERRKENDSCVYGETSTKLLDRTLYPNGLTQGIWDVIPGTMTLAFAHAYIVHNNWVQRGPLERWDRLRRHGFKFHDNETGLCIYDMSEEDRLKY